MTPEEKAVIDAAMEWHYAILANPSAIPLVPMSGPALALEGISHATWQLVTSCPECNAGGHTCPGDGNSINHTATDCGEHEDLRQSIADASTYPCWECLVDPTEDPAPWCDCQPGALFNPAHSYPCRNRAHSPENCLNRPEPEPTWEPATLLYTLAGDRIRIGQDETDVLRSSSGAWHAQVVSSVLPSGKTWDKVTPWEHTELRLDLSANPGFQEYPPNLPCEILCTPERLAILNLMQGIPGTTVIKR